ncbi:hypothetical protein [Persicirhabdus sediminis]|uniref:Uncharacterized protein n=1 Tax=Persicirhabdus sediminis TaxID=454144 RepID=A0A8J7SLR6_9BACT|nr:hypothetical protein [Persicirhabdus sediminis]MBK1791545.1 hypothetical protein [Persicirhabdus sediminis]
MRINRVKWMTCAVAATVAASGLANAQMVDLGDIVIAKSQADFLHQETPAWLSIGAPYTIKKIDGGLDPVYETLATESNGNSQYRYPSDMKITGFSVTVALADGEWKFESTESRIRSASLNLDRKKLIITQGDDARLYELSDDGSEYRLNEKVKFPKVNYNAELSGRGLISGKWRWVTNDLACAISALDNHYDSLRMALCLYNPVTQTLHAWNIPLGSGMLGYFDMKNGIIRTSQRGRKKSEPRISYYQLILESELETEE